MKYPAEADVDASAQRERLLMSQVSEGDSEAFTELFDTLAPSVLGILIQLLRQRSLAEETLQETFLQVWLRADSYQPSLGSPRQWIFVIARSRALDSLRRESSRRRREEAFTQEDDGVLHPTGTARLEARQRRSFLQESLAVLSVPQQACLALALGDGLSHSAIAERLSMPLGSVKSRVRLGMLKLGKLLR